MNLHEYQARALLKAAGIPVPDGDVASTPSEVESLARRIDGTVVVKAQVHAGGRGKAGGVKLAKTPAEALGNRGAHPRHADQGPDRAQGAGRARCGHRVGGLPRADPRSRLPATGVHGEPGRRHRHRGSGGQDAGEDHASPGGSALRAPAAPGDDPRLLPLQQRQAGPRGGRHHAPALQGVHGERGLARRNQPADHDTRRDGCSRSTPRSPSTTTNSIAAPTSRSFATRPRRIRAR